MRTGNIRFRLSHSGIFWLTMLPLIVVLRLALPFFKGTEIAEVVVPVFRILLGLGAFACIIYFITWISSSSTEM